MHHEATKDDDVFLLVPTGKWLHRTDLPEETSVPYPIAAYGLDDSTFVIWSDGRHTLGPTDDKFPVSNWVVVE